MIFYNTETSFTLKDESMVTGWLTSCIEEEEKKQGEVHYIFCDDEYLSGLNLKYLKHNTLTDVISFDYTMGRLISGDIFISIDRVKENSREFNVRFYDELHRVMVHGLLHFCGYKDKTNKEKGLMRSKEDYYLSLRSFNEN
jgi:probable rRNA maturation factor